ncbi:AAA family ATPase [Corynebacterium sp. MC-04]|uniref:AAA family ATPase n=1 Tax=Corynebacterium parakroppenstedtii TaxID=2828363 RepID=A0ABS9HJW7_9CORY|nr:MULTISPECIES: AAA family ATPase [Corynebacterium]KXB51314.1 ATPase family protein [Corynebacterium kroppenstedtii]MBY0791961.1 AAA family ATPase [Corynebacterium parakroppenstedtii]MCF6768911.1 AAA family ATPase [Corynebacterium parakroppenstedtii]MCF6771229.1 AAA family ATPase [Corynebacterium parakroppenstedtii]MCF6773321.1 AAA family ATPase [Corynebacterium parakroppenstedtii]
MLPSSHSVSLFPFSAVVGQDQLKLALILTAISPRIGGVVVRGEKGTAKTTTVRAFSRMLPDPKAKVVNLPLGATEDRVVGSIDVERVLTTGHAEYQPGLLSEANGGVLYVDEINLLADHLVDIILDAAATGYISIERDAVSHTEDTDFVLVGTMNPEEGELRPQLLDRFGLAVDVSAPRDTKSRTEVMRRRLAFDENPEEFLEQWADAERDIATRIVAAKERVTGVELTDVVLGRIASICASFDVDGMRADLVIARAAAAHAAWEGRTTIKDSDIKVAAELALPHRRRDPFDSPDISDDELDEALDRARDEVPDEPDDDPAPDNTEDSDGDVDTNDVDDLTSDDGHSDGTPDPSADHPTPQQNKSDADNDDNRGPAPQEGGRAAQGAPFRR